MKGKGISIVCIVVATLLLTLPSHLVGTDDNSDGPPITIQDMQGDMIDAVEIEEKLADVEGFFTENRGQFGDDRIRYVARGDPLSVILLDDRVIFRFEEERCTISGPYPEGSYEETVRTTHFAMVFMGCNRIVPMPVEIRDHRMNYLLGDDEEEWVRGAETCSEVLYEDLYDGVDLRFYFTHDRLKYDFLLDSASLVSKIRIHYENIEGLTVDPGSGNLVIEHRLGVVRDSAPVVFEKEGVDMEGASGEFVVERDNTVGYKVPAALLESDEGIIIDPGIEYATYYGGDYYDILKIRLARDDSIYVTGHTVSMNWSIPLTNDSYDPQGHMSSPRNYDLYLAKFDWRFEGPPIFGTFIGGSHNDRLCGATLDEDKGVIYLCGNTLSKDFPLAGDCYQSEKAGNDSTCDGFIAAMGLDGKNLVYSTYFGGSDHDQVSKVHIDKDGNFIIQGFTRTDDGFPITPDAFCSTRFDDFFHTPMYIARMDSTLRNITYCTLVDGTVIWSDKQGWILAYHTSILDDEGNLWIMDSTTFNVSWMVDGAYDDTHDGYSDGIILRFNFTANTIDRSSFIGGDSKDLIYRHRIGPDGKHYLVGWTNSKTGFPFTTDQNTVHGPEDGFFMVLDHDLSGVEYCTPIGGTNGDAIYEIFLDPDNGRIVLGGWTWSNDFDTTDGCFDNELRDLNPLSSSSGDSAILVLNYTTYSLEYSTLLGGSGQDAAPYFESDSMGNLWFMLSSTSTDFPVSPDGFKRVNSGYNDKIFGIFDPTPCERPPAPTFLNATPGDRRIELEWWAPEWDGSTFKSYIVWRGTNASCPEKVTEIPAKGYYERNEYIDDQGLTNGMTYYYRIQAVNTAGPGERTESIKGTPAGTPPPVRHPRAVSRYGWVCITWSPPITNGGYPLLGYRIYRSGGSGGFVPVEVGPNTTHYHDTEVDILTRYSYSVLAYNEKGPGDYLTVSIEVDFSAPSETKNLRLTPVDTGVHLEWDPPDFDGGADLKRYRIYRCHTPHGEYKHVHSVDAEQTNFTDYGLENGREYWFYVIADNGGDLGDPSEIFSAIPFGHPGEPLDLKLEVSPGTVKLSWKVPAFDGGRPISTYNVYWKPPGEDMKPLVSLDQSQKRHIKDGLTNGEEYTFQVTAVNSGGLEGPPCGALTVRPCGLPGEVTAFLVNEGDDDTISITWGPPSDTGGTSHFRYTVLRGTSQGNMVPLFDSTEDTSYIDDNFTFGIRHYYSVRPWNHAGWGSEVTPKDIVVYTGPGQVTLSEPVPHDGYVTLSWVDPTFNGGSPISGYIIRRGLTKYNLDDEIGTIYVNTYKDETVENGRTYWYAVITKNDHKQGINCTPLSATPLPTPPPVKEFKVRVIDDEIVLSWLPPSEKGCFPVTGYKILRGTLPGDLKEYEILSIATTYSDTSVDRGIPYYYQVVPLSDEGPGMASSVETAEIDDPPFPIPTSGLYIFIGAIIILAITGVAFFVHARRRVEEEPQEEVAESLENVPPWRMVEVQAKKAKKVAKTAPAVVASPEEDSLLTYIVEEIFVVYRDGRLITSSAREECRTEDADLMSGMLIAVQGLIQDGLERGGRLESIKYGENIVSMATGDHVILVAVVYGRPDDRLQETLQDTVAQVENAYSGIIEDWTGAPSALSGLDGMIQPLLDSTTYLTRDDVGAAKAERGVFLLSSIDFHRGYVRLKMAAMNSTEDTLMDAAIEVRYDSDMLRLERVEPDAMTAKGDRIALGNVKPGERKTVAVLFDPQICQRSYVDGQVSYYDHKGELRYVEMKRRLAEVVCPVFFTRENANTGMLRRLMVEELHASDIRVYRYPPSLRPTEVLAMGKRALADDEMQLVREYINERPRYEAEIWYYAETKVKRLRFVIRLGVIQEKGVLELFAASTSMEAVTGLLAEFRRELDDILDADHHGSPVLERAEDIRKEVESRPLMIYEEDEPREQVET